MLVVLLALVSCIYTYIYITHYFSSVIILLFAQLWKVILRVTLLIQPSPLLVGQGDTIQRVSRVIFDENKRGVGLSFPCPTEDGARLGCPRLDSSRRPVGGLLTLIVGTLACFIE